MQSPCRRSRQRFGRLCNAQQLLPVRCTIASAKRPDFALPHCKFMENMLNSFCNAASAGSMEEHGDFREFGRHRLGARTPVGSFNGALAGPAGHAAGRGRPQGGDGARQGRGRGGRRGHPGPDPDRRPGPESGPPGLDRRRHPGRKPGLGRQPAVRLGPARGGARPAADRRAAMPRSSPPAARNR